MDKNKTVRFFDPEYKLLMEIDDYELIYKSRWSNYGQFELHVQGMEPYMQIDNRIIFDRDERKNGIIKYIHSEEDGSVTIKGFTLLWLLGERLTVPESGAAYQIYKNCPAEDVLIDLVSKNMVDCEDSKRKMPGFVCAETQSRGILVNCQTRYEGLLEVAKEISVASGLGICVRMDLENRQDVFEVLEGTDRSIDQESTAPVVYSREYDNIKTSAYTINDKESRNCAYVAGQGEETEREVCIVGDELSGYERKELFVDARDIEDAEDLPARGETKLAGYEKQESFEIEITSDWYKSRWELGDIVTVIDSKHGRTLTHRITETEEDVDANGYTVIPTLGISEG